MTVKPPECLSQVQIYATARMFVAARPNTWRQTQIEGALVVKNKLTGTINTTIEPQKQTKRSRKKAIAGVAI